MDCPVSVNDTQLFMGLWEQINNINFKVHEFVNFKNNAGSNNFNPSIVEWIERTGAIGIISKRGRYGGTCAHWIAVLLLSTADSIATPCSVNAYGGLLSPILSELEVTNCDLKFEISFSFS